MRLHKLSTGTKISGAFAVVSLAIVIISLVALWCMQGADARTSDLVNNKLARQQLTSELLGIARLNGVRAVSIARSDSVEVAEYFEAQLAQGERTAAALEQRLGAVPVAAAEHALIGAAAQRKAAYMKVRELVLKAKSQGQIQEAERLAGNELGTAFDAYTAALEALLAYHTQAAHETAAASAEAFSTSRVLLLVLGGLALLVGGCCGWLLTRSIVTPLQDAVRLAEHVARSDLSVTIAHDRGDEIGRLFDALNHMTGGVSDTVARVLDSAHLIDQASVDMAADNRNLAQRTEKQASNLDATVQAMVALTEAVQQNHANAHDASELALAASSVAEQGAHAVKQMVERMATIRQLAARIGDITAMIDSIAFQTNILALNAAVEAARAGAEGRGFAVVAAEVRNLAQHSAAAAKEIKSLIGESTGAIESGAGMANAAGGTMRDVLDRVRKVASLLQTIDAASSEQDSNIVQVRKVIAEMDHATQQNLSMVAQAVDTAETMRAQAERLTGVVAIFKMRPGTRGLGAGTAQAPALAA